MAERRKTLKDLTLVLSPDDVHRLGPGEEKGVERLKLENTEYLFGETPVQAHLSKTFIYIKIII